MKNYPQYKDSGIEWLGEVPSEWETVRLRYIAEIETGEKDTVDRVDDGVFPFFVRAQKVERIDTYSFDGEAILTAGDGVGVGKVFHYINGKFDYHQRVYRISDFRNMDGKYLFYYLRENMKKEVLKGNAKSTVDSLRLHMFKNFPILIPNIEEQTGIANFLDHKTRQIDDLIAKKERLIELLKEERTAVINQAVTKGLDPNVPMKDSGVEWLGEIPENWELKRLKFLINERLKYGANESAEEEIMDHPRYIRITDFNSDGNLRNDTFKSLHPDIANEYLLKEGDVLFARSGATVGKTFIFNDYEGQACFAGYLIKASPNNKILEPDFLYYVTLSNFYENWKDSVFIQATIQNIGADKYQNLLIPTPPIDEQKMIIDYIKENIQRINLILYRTQDEINLYNEYKTSLINEAVTGKIDVRDYEINHAAT